MSETGKIITVDLVKLIHWSIEVKQTRIEYGFSYKHRMEGRRCQKSGHIEILLQEAGDAAFYFQSSMRRHCKSMTETTKKMTPFQQVIHNIHRPCLPLSFHPQSTLKIFEISIGILFSFPPLIEMPSPLFSCLFTTTVRL